MPLSTVTARTAYTISEQNHMITEQYRPNQASCLARTYRLWNTRVTNRSETLVDYTSYTIPSVVVPSEGLEQN